MHTRNTPKSSAGIYVDPLDNTHFEEQCAKFKHLWHDPKRKTPERTQYSDCQRTDWHVAALYMLHGLPTAHALYKVVADPAGLAGNGFISNRGSQGRSHQVGVPITTKEVRGSSKAGDLAPIQADFLIQDFVPAEEIINAMSPQQQAHFNDTLVMAIRIVESTARRITMTIKYEPSRHVSLPATA